MDTAFGKTRKIAIVALIVVNVFELGFLFKVRRDSSLYKSSASFPLPSGYLLNKDFLAAEAAPCFLIRISADGCPYCRLDQVQYDQLVQRAQKRHCQTIVLPPKTGDIRPSNNSGGILQLQYVNMKFGRVVNPFMTPETILLDGTGGMIWEREGVMDKGSLSDALEAFAKIR